MGPDPVDVVSFGYLHAPPPEAHAVFDVRHHFRDPHVNPALRHLTATDLEVVAAVMATPGISALAGAITATAWAFAAGPQPGPITIAIGCAGGRHRSAVLAAKVAGQLAASGMTVHVTHRDIGRPVVTAGRDAGSRAN